MDEYVPSSTGSLVPLTHLAGTYYKDRRAGCFQCFVTVPAHTVLPIPSNLTSEESSCLGVAALTAAMTLWRWLEVPGSPIPQQSTISPSGYLLIWGGSTVTAQFAIQLATLAGLKVITVTSLKTRCLAENLGATHTVVRDNKSCDEIVAEILQLTNGEPITRAIDLVGNTTAAHCLKALSATSSKSLFAPLAMLSSSAVIPDNVSVQTVEMKQFVLNPASRVYATELNRLVESRNISLPSITILEGGWEQVLEGLDRLKGGDMAGKKMVVRIL
jgi:NADPH:quinone reductase-like Zn-dependent oxidoreductase